MILVVCLNLAIDITVEVEHLELGQVHRSTSTLREAGGKGVNVARVLQTLGAPCILIGFLGGAAGEFIADSLSREGISCAPCPIQSESRSCYIVTETQRSLQTVVNEAGPQVNAAESLQFQKQFSALLNDVDLVMISGSLPPGVAHDTYAQLISLAQATGKRTLLDSSAAALTLAFEARPFLLKVNDAEANTLFGQRVTTPAETAAAAQQFCSGSTEVVMITLGADGAVLSSRQENYLITPPKVQAKNSVGSGDAAFAGLAAALSSGLPMEQAGRLAVAAGTANALHGGGHCTMAEIMDLQDRVQVKRI